MCKVKPSQAQMTRRFGRPSLIGRTPIFGGADTVEQIILRGNTYYRCLGARKSMSLLPFLAARTLRINPSRFDLFGGFWSPPVGKYRVLVERLPYLGPVKSEPEAGWIWQLKKCQPNSICTVGVCAEPWQSCDLGLSGRHKYSSSHTHR